MQGGAIELAAQARRALAQGGLPDAVLATDMVNLPAWLGLLRGLLPDRVAVIVYMHENQLTYPWRTDEKRDLTYGVINWLSQLATDQVWFNSHYHLESWFSELPRCLKHYPDYNHVHLTQAVRRRSLVAPVGIACDLFAKPVRRRNPTPTEINLEEATPQPPLVVWNQRWEYDKRPGRFFRLLYRLQAAGIPFRLAVAGENFRKTPGEFDEAKQRLADRIVHWGYLSSRQAYADLLCRADLVISTADHEFFGVSILEAVCAGAFPLLPDRLSYPELIPRGLHPACLYSDAEDLFQKAAWRLTHPRAAPPSLRDHIIQTYDWPVVAGQYDALIKALVDARRTG